jgi:hypothetical protein
MKNRVEECFAAHIVHMGLKIGQEKLSVNI